MNEFFDIIFDAALNDRKEMLTDDVEYQNEIAKLVELCDAYRKLDLTEEQRQIIDEMMDTEDIVNMKEMLVIYKKGILHGVEVLKNLQLLK